MAERDEHIQEKERKVYDLKKRNQELEKFKFVLDFRIKQLKEQVEPRENEIADMTSQIQDINIELDQLSREKVSLEEKISKLGNVLMMKKKDYVKEHGKVIKYNSQIKGFRADLQDCVHYFQEPHLLKKSIENLARKYGARESDIQNTKMSLVTKQESLDQQEFLRTKISSLRIQTESSVARFKTMNFKSIIENRSLIKEIEALRHSKSHSMRPPLQKTGIEEVAQE
jgi:chromosome segregation ATPase